MTESIAVLKYRKKPVLIEAIQWWPNAGVHHDGVWCDQEGPDAGRPYVITIHNQRAYLAPGDWILPEPKPGHFYPCKPDIFQNTYEPEEIAGHTEASGYAASLLQWAEWIDQRKCDLEEIDTEELRKSAAALRAQAQEVERLTGLIDDMKEDQFWRNDEEKAGQAVRIAELEAERDKPIYLQADNGWYAISVGKPRYCFFGKTIEEAKDKEARALTIRALNQPEAGGGK